MEIFSEALIEAGKNSSFTLISIGLVVLGFSLLTYLITGRSR